MCTAQMHTRYWTNTHTILHKCTHVTSEDIMKNKNRESLIDNEPKLI
jgi:hypothetical protein